MCCKFFKQFVNLDFNAFNCILILNIWYIARKDKGNPMEHRDMDVSTIQYHLMVPKSFLIDVIGFFGTSPWNNQEHLPPFGAATLYVFIYRSEGKEFLRDFWWQFKWNANKKCHRILFNTKDFVVSVFAPANVVEIKTSNCMGHMRRNLFCLVSSIQIPLFQYAANVVLK